MATNVINNNYKSCPLKKRPIIITKDDEENIEQLPIPERSTTFAMTKVLDYCVPSVQNDQPQDLSLKRKHSDDFDDCVIVLPKRECVLNLSKNADLNIPMPYTYAPASPVSNSNSSRSSSIEQQYALSSSSMLSPVEQEDQSVEHVPLNLHLRGLTATSTGYTTNPYQSAFVMAAGCNPMTLWNTYQPAVNGIYPSPASSVMSAASPQSAYSYPQMTPPSSPGSDCDSSEPEDLSVRSDIPLPALFHFFDEATAVKNNSFPSSKSSSASSSSATSSSANDRQINDYVNAAASTAATAANKNYRFKCDKCTKMYSTSIGLSKHQQFHCPAAECNQEKKQHSCQDCGKLYTTIGALKMHIRTHTLPCKCQICGKAFSRPWLLQGHIRTHTGEKPFQCPDCPRSFADRSNLRAHQQTHVDVKKYACKICKKSFSRMSLLNKHVSSNCAIIIA